MHEVIANGTAQGPYSTVIRAGGFVFLSGQGGLDPTTGRPVAQGIESETRQALSNITQLLDEADLALCDLVQMTCYLTDLMDWSRMNKVYAEILGPDIRPTRTTVGVGQLPFGLCIEITAVAFGGTPCS